MKWSLELLSLHKVMWFTGVLIEVLIVLIDSSGVLWKLTNPMNIGYARMSLYAADVSAMRQLWRY